MGYVDDAMPSEEVEVTRNDDEKFVLEATVVVLEATKAEARRQVEKEKL
jgi:hypothetical protein